MEEKTSGTGSVYLYGVIQGTEDKDLGLKGLFDSQVQTLREGDISAVISEIPPVDKLRPERKYLGAHRDVVSHLVQNESVVLPVAFGTIAEDKEGIRDMLRKYRNAFQEQMKKVSGKAEMELRVSYEVPNVFEYFLKKYPELKEERDQIFAPGNEPTRDEKIGLGQHFEQMQSQEREELTKRMEEKLSGRCAEIKENTPRNEKEVMRLSCLIGKQDADNFRKAVEEASKLFDDNFSIEYGGPEPPYNFVEVRVQR